MVDAEVFNNEVNEDEVFEEVGDDETVVDEVEDEVFEEVGEDEMVFDEVEDEVFEEVGDNEMVLDDVADNDEVVEEAASALVEMPEVLLIQERSGVTYE